MSTSQNKRSIGSLMGILLLLSLPIFLIEAGVGCAEIQDPKPSGSVPAEKQIREPSALASAEIQVREPSASAPASFSVYALSRGKGVPEEAEKVLDHARQVLKEGQEQGKVKRLIERRIGLEGETRLCAEFLDEHVAAGFFDQLHQFSFGVDLVNIKKETCPP